jgi:hypothetical protein
MQCRYSVTLRGVRATIVQWESNKHYISCVCVCVCICSLRYPAYNVHAPYCHLWFGLLFNIYPHYLKNCKIFEKKKDYGTQNVCSFPYIFCPKYFSLEEELGEIWSEMYIGLHVEYTLFLSDFTAN